MSVRQVKCAESSCWSPELPPRPPLALPPRRRSGSSAVAAALDDGSRKPRAGSTRQSPDEMKVGCVDPRTVLPARRQLRDPAGVGISALIGGACRSAKPIVSRATARPQSPDSLVAEALTGSTRLERESNRLDSCGPDCRVWANPTVVLACDERRRRSSIAATCPSVLVCSRPWTRARASTRQPRPSTSPSPRGPLARSPAGRPTTEGRIVSNAAAPGECGSTRRAARRLLPDQTRSPVSGSRSGLLDWPIPRVPFSSWRVVRRRLQCGGVQVG